MEALQRDSRFFTRMATALIVLTLIAFSTTYLLPVARDRFSGDLILHVHGVLFLAWPLFFLVQSLSIVRSRRLHRALGLAGISLATGMVLTGLAAIGSSIATWQARGIGLEGQAISVVAFTGVVTFAVFFGLAIGRSRNRVAHPRLMVLATLAIMQGAWGRIGLLVLTQGNPEMLRPGLLPPPPGLAPVAAIHLIFDLSILCLMAWHDRRCHGAVQRVTLVGGGALLAVIATRHLAVETAAWRVIAGWLVQL